MSSNRRKAGRTLAALGTAVILAPAAGCVALAVAHPQSGSQPASPATVLRGRVLVGRAEQQVARANSDCDPQTSVPKPLIRFGPGAPSRGMRSAFGVLRRPQTEAERDKPALFAKGYGTGDITLFRSATRIVRLPGGMSATITVGRGRMSVPEILSPTCQRLVTAVLSSLTKGEPAAVRRAATDFQRILVRNLAVQGTREWLGIKAPAGEGLSVWDATAFDDQGGMLGTSDDWVGTAGPRGSQTRTRSRELAIGMVPDGVASVTLQLAGESPEYALISPSGSTPPRGGTIRVPVTDNVFAFLNLPEDPFAAATRVVTWRDANGRVVHVARLG